MSDSIKDSWYTLYEHVNKEIRNKNFKQRKELDDIFIELERLCLDLSEKEVELLNELRQYYLTKNSIEDSIEQKEKHHNLIYTTDIKIFDYIRNYYLKKRFDNFHIAKVMSFNAVYLMILLIFFKDNWSFLYLPVGILITLYLCSLLLFIFIENGYNYYKRKEGIKHLYMYESVLPELRQFQDVMKKIK